MSLRKRLKVLSKQVASILHTKGKCFVRANTEYQRSVTQMEVRPLPNNMISDSLFGSLPTNLDSPGGLADHAASQRPETIETALRLRRSTHEQLVERRNAMCVAAEAMHAIESKVRDETLVVGPLQSSFTTASNEAWPYIEGLRLREPDCIMRTTEQLNMLPLESFRRAHSFPCEVRPRREGCHSRSAPTSRFAQTPTLSSQNVVRYNKALPPLPILKPEAIFARGHLSEGKDRTTGNCTFRTQRNLREESHESSHHEVSVPIDDATVLPNSANSRGDRIFPTSKRPQLFVTAKIEQVELDDDSDRAAADPSRLIVAGPRKSSGAISIQEVDCIPACNYLLEEDIYSLGSGVFDHEVRYTLGKSHSIWTSGQNVANASPKLAYHISPSCGFQGPKSEVATTAIEKSLGKISPHFLAEHHSKPDPDIGYPARQIINGLHSFTKDWGPNRHNGRCQAGRREMLINEEYTPSPLMGPKPADSSQLQDLDAWIPSPPSLSDGEDASVLEDYDEEERTRVLEEEIEQLHFLLEKISNMPSNDEGIETQRKNIFFVA